MKPKAHPGLLAQVVELIPPRLVKKLDADPSLALSWTWNDDGTVVTSTGETVTLAATEGVLSSPDQVVCSCLMAPRCLHRLAVVSVLEVADGSEGPATAEESATLEPESDPPEIQASSAQKELVGLVWQSVVGILHKGVMSLGVVEQGRLLNLAFHCREAALYRAGAGLRRVAEGLRSLRADEPGFQLETFVEQVEELAKVAYQLHHLGRFTVDWVGTARRRYEPLGNLKLWGLFCESVVTASGFAGVVTWFVGNDGKLYQSSTVAPGEPQRVLQTYRAGTPLPGLSLSPQELCRSVILLQQATMSSDRRLGAGAKVQAAVSGSSDWSMPEVRALWTKGLFETESLAFFEGPALGVERDTLIVGTSVGPVRLVAPPAGDLPGRDNLELLARAGSESRRWVARVHPGKRRTATLLAVDFALPAEWRGRTNLGCDRLHASHFEALPPRARSIELADDPRPFGVLERGLGRIVLAGRSAAPADRSVLRALDGLGLITATRLWRALQRAAVCGERDLLGIWRPAEGDEFGRRWLALSVYLRAACESWANGAWMADDQSSASNSPSF